MREKLNIWRGGEEKETSKQKTKQPGLQAEQSFCHEVKGFALTFVSFNASDQILVLSPLCTEVLVTQFCSPIHPDPVPKNPTG